MDYDAAVAALQMSCFSNMNRCTERTALFEVLSLSLAVQTVLASARRVARQFPAGLIVKLLGQLSGRSDDLVLLGRGLFAEQLRGADLKDMNCTFGSFATSSTSNAVFGPSPSWLAAALEAPSTLRNEGRLAWSRSTPSRSTSGVSPGWM